jgi:O-antigen ligase
MCKLLVSIFLSFFFLGVTRLITQNWIAALLVAIFVLLFAFFALSLVTAARIGDEI